MRLFILWALCACLLVCASSCGEEFNNTVRGWFGVDSPDWQGDGPGPGPRDELAAVSGTVLREDDNSPGTYTDPVVNAAVFILKDATASPDLAIIREGQTPMAGTVAWDYTDAQGNFSFEDVPFGNYRLHIVRLDPILSTYVRDSRDITVDSETEALPSSLTFTTATGSGGSGGAGDVVPASIRGNAQVTGQSVIGAVYYLALVPTDTGSGPSALPPYPQTAGQGAITTPDGRFVIEDIFTKLALPPMQQTATVRMVVVKVVGNQRWAYSTSMTIDRNLNYIISGADNEERITLAPLGAGL